jgi:hypothetical protein
LAPSAHARSSRSHRGSYCGLDSRDFAVCQFSEKLTLGGGKAPAVLHAESHDKGRTPIRHVDDISDLCKSAIEDRHETKLFPEIQADGVSHTAVEILRKFRRAPAGYS